MHKEASPRDGGIAPSYGLLDDFYTSTTYNPSNLVEQWMSLRQEYDRNAAAMGTTFSSPSNNNNNNGLATSRSFGGGRSATLRATSRRVSCGGGQLSSGGSDAFSDGSSETSSNDSAYARHRRYDTAMAAYQAVCEPYQRHVEVQRQHRFMNETKRLGRPFIPANGRLPADVPTRHLLGDAVAAIYRGVQRDWPELRPSVVSTAEDLLVVFFPLREMKPHQRSMVVRYMSRSTKRSEAVREFGLVRVVEGWDVETSDGHLMFTLRPPWVPRGTFMPAGHTRTSC